MAKVTKDMTFAEVLKISRETAPIFLKHGMHCIGCPISSMESLEMGAEAHGTDVEALVAELNAFLESDEAEDKGSDCGCSGCSCN